MKPLHKIPKEKILPHVSDSEKRGMVYLHNIGYVAFRRDSGNWWTIWTRTSTTGLSNIMVTEFDYPDMRETNDINLWRPEWIRS